MRTKKILFYSHDTFGLGHIRRTQKIANRLARADRSILIVCASPKASSFASQPGIEYLNLPGFTKQVTGEYIPRSLNIPTDEFVNLRAHLLLSAVRSFDPDIVIVDKEPLGVKKELIPALEYLRQFRKSCQVVCGFRDILDEMEAVHKEWSQRDTLRALKDYYHTIFVYGEKSIYDFAAEYQLTTDLSSRLVYTGYVQPKENLDDEILSMKFEGNSTRRGMPLVTFTLGGGGDGWEFLEAYLRMLKNSGSEELEFSSVILTGPFASPSLQQDARELAEARTDIESHTFIPNTHALFQRSDLVISMGGYNTFCELASMQQFPLILPRIKPRKEQLIRAEVFKSKGLCDFIHPDQISSETLLTTIRSMLKSNLKPRTGFRARGLDSIANIVDQLLGQKSKNQTEVPPHISSPMARVGLIQQTQDLITSRGLD